MQSDYTKLSDDSYQPRQAKSAAFSDGEESPLAHRPRLGIDSISKMKVTLSRKRPSMPVSISKQSFCEEQENDCPLTPMVFGVHSYNEGPADMRLQEALAAGRVDPEPFDNATMEAYYLVHNLRGGVLFRAAERAAHNESHLGDLQQLLDMIPADDTHACMASYNHFGRNEIHVMHLAASLGSIEVMKRLKAHFDYDVVNRQSTYFRHMANSEAITTLGSGNRRMTVGHTFSVPTHLSGITDDGGFCVALPHYAPLLSAVYMSRTEAVVWLLNNNANPNLPNVDGQTALHLLARSGLPYEIARNQDEALEQIILKLVQCSADMDKRTSSLDHLPDSTADYLRRKTALELAASKMSSYPKHMLHLLAKSFQTPDLSEPLKEVSFIAQMNPAAAEHLMEKVKTNRLARKRLWFEVHNDGHDGLGGCSVHMDNFVKVLRMAPVAAADILEILTFRPLVRSLQKNPLPSYAWLFNREMQCAYQADVSRPECRGTSSSSLQRAFGQTGPPMPIWEFPPVEWHSKFRTDLPLNPLAQDKVYEVEVRVVHMPDLLNIRVPHVLYRMWNYSRYTEIFARIPVQAIIVCLWQSVSSAYLLSLGTEVGVLMALLVYGLIPPPDDWDVMMHLLNSVILAKVFIDIWNTLHCAQQMYLQTGATQWSYIFHYAPIEVICSVFLVFQALVHADPHLNVDGAGKVLIAANIFMRCLKIMGLCRSQQGVGETILAVQQSFLPTQHMLFIMLGVFCTFYCVFLTLKDPDKSPEYIFLYLWLALIFGEGDGIEDISGFDTDHENYKGDGSKLVLQASIFFMLIASGVFAVVLLNLMIAMYSNYYEQMVPWARLLFHKMRAKDCIQYMLRPSLPVWLVRCLGTVWCRRGAVCLAGLFILLWFALTWLTHVACWDAVLLAVALQLLQAATLLDEYQASDQRHYLWVCYRSDYDEVHRQGSDKWQRMVRRDIVRMQESIDTLSEQVAQFMGIPAKDSEEEMELPPRHAHSIRRLRTNP